MWPRVVEAMVGCWLMITPFVFRGTASLDDYAIDAAVCGALVLTCAFASMWPPAAWMRLGTIAVALWLTAHGYFGAERPGPPAAQNEITVGLILILFAVLPNQINEVPAPWRPRTGSSPRTRD
jgi:hypothetical protein